jgi:hypothetical protein
MGLRAKLSRLQKAMRGNMDYIELVDGSRHWFDPEDASKELFLYFTDSLGAVYHETPRPEPPEILRAVASATDREAAFRRAYSMAPAPWCPLDVPALVERGEFVPRSLVAGQTEDGPIPDLSE